MVCIFMVEKISLTQLIWYTWRKFDLLPNVLICSKLSSTIGTSLIFQGKTAQNANRKQKYCTAYTQTCKIIFKNANTASWTSTDNNYLRWHSDCWMTNRSIVSGRYCSNRFCYNDIGKSLRVWLCWIDWCIAITTRYSIWILTHTRSGWKFETKRKMNKYFRNAYTNGMCWLASQMQTIENDSSFNIET